MCFFIPPNVVCFNETFSFFLVHWNSLITMQFLDLLKDYQVNNKNSNFKRGNVWENITADMKRLGHKISVDELSKKWNVLSTNYQRTVAYNSTHRDKKKCAFFKRLMELHNHQPFNCFNEKQSAKQTVEVSPFSFSQASSSNISAISLSPNFNNQKAFKEKAKQSNNSSSDLLDWLNNTWTEFKEMERQRREVENQRHNEIMEMLSYLIESKDKHH